MGGPSDDLCVPDNTPSGCTTASLGLILSEDVPIRDVLAGPPQSITSPLAIEAADSSFTGLDFVPRTFTGGPIAPGAVLYTLEGDFGFSPPNASEGAPEVGHEVKLINFDQKGNRPSPLRCRDSLATSRATRPSSAPIISQDSIAPPTFGLARTTARMLRITAPCVTTERTRISSEKTTDRSCRSQARE